MEAELGREKTLMQQALVSLERLRDEAARSVSEPPHNSRLPQQMDVEDPEEEIRRWRAQVAVVARASGGARNGGESCQEGSDFVHTSVGVDHIAFWSSRIAKRVRFDEEPHQCRHVERGPQCLARSCTG